MEDIPVVSGPGNISARVVCDSINERGKRITTFELFYPRFIHAEVMTHRVFARNAASSRAIPIQKMVARVLCEPATPVHWGANQSGMQAHNELTGIRKLLAKGLWRAGSFIAGLGSYLMYKVGVHKQIANRITETFQNYKVVMTTTELTNFFELRDHPDAQPEIRELARVMVHALNESKPIKLSEEEWHVPYVLRKRDSEGKLKYYDTETNEELTITEALMVSASCCAQVSFRSLNTGLDVAKRIYKKLIESEPRHASPVEHQARPMMQTAKGETSMFDPLVWEGGVTHMNKEGVFCSGNLVDFVQYRQLIPDNTKH